MSAFGVLFFPKSCLNVGGAAYTRVRLIHESLRYLLQILLCQIMCCNILQTSCTCIFYFKVFFTRKSSSLVSIAQRGKGGGGGRELAYDRGKERNERRMETDLGMVQASFDPQRRPCQKADKYIFLYFLNLNKINLESAQL